MQRPLLVLVLVLGALVALTLGLFSFLAEPAVPGGIETQRSKPTTERPPEPRSGVTTPGSEIARQSPDALARETAVHESTFTYDNRLEGLVVDGAARPVADASVTLSSTGTGKRPFGNVARDPSGELVRRTDAEGKFAFPSLAPRDRYKLVVLHPEFARKELFTIPVGAQGAFVEPPIVLSTCAGLTGLVRDDRGQPIPGATLDLDGSMYQHAPFVAPDRMTATANAEGAFTFLHVPEGNRALTVRAAGFGTLTVTALDFDCGAIQTRDVTLKAAESITGRVVGPGNKGIPGVNLLAVGINLSQQTARGMAVTNDQGEFSVEGLMPGKYNLVAHTRGWMFKAQQVQSPSKNLVFEGIEQARACGHVVDAETGAPISDFQVRLRLTFEGHDLTQPISESLVVVEGAADGEFCIPGVQESSDSGYLIEARAKGYAPGFSVVFPITAGRTVQGLDVRLGHGGTLSGRLVDGDGQPVARALVQTHDNDWADDDFPQATKDDEPTQCTAAAVRTNAQGRFTLPNLSPGLYQITIEAAGFAALEQADIAVVLGAENNIGDVRLGRGGQIRGRLLDSAGKPIVSGEIELRLLDGSHPRAYRAKSAGDGAYTLSAIVSGRYELRGSRHEGDRGLPLGSTSSKVSERQITVAEGDVLADVDIELAP